MLLLGPSGRFEALGRRLQTGQHVLHGAQLGLQTAWEIDLFGGNRLGAQAAQARALTALVTEARAGRARYEALREVTDGGGAAARDLVDLGAAVREGLVLEKVLDALGLPDAR